MASTIRRVVTGQAENGRAVILADGPPLGAESPPRVFWQTTSQDDRIAPSEASQAETMEFGPPTDGTLYLIAEWPPGLVSARHRTNTIDYVTILSGEIWLCLDETEVLLNAGDCVVQGGVVHTWKNRTQETCFASVVMVGTNTVLNEVTHP
jgi:quercetin dioxygenase-like cupin family protein